MFKKQIALLVVLLLLAVPTLAQTDTLDETYTLDSGTHIDYPAGWDAELVDELVVISRSQTEQVIIIDYPLLLGFGDAGADTPLGVLELFVRDVAELNFDQNNISRLNVAAREAVRYDVPTTNGGNSSIFAVRFSNDAIGMALFFGVSDMTITAMLDSFNNEAPADAPATLAIGEFVPQRPGVYIFNAGEGRFSYPAGWSLSANMSGTLEYATLVSPDSSVTAIIADVTPALRLDTPITTVLDELALDFEATFGVGVSVGVGKVVRLGDHDGVRYLATVTVDGVDSAGELVLVEYTEGGFGFVLMYGDLSQFTAEQSRFIGSLNNKFYGLRHID